MPRCEIRWRQISWLGDIVQLARSHTLDWTALRVEAERLGIVRIVAVTFLLAAKLLGAEFPEPLSLDADSTTKALANRVLKLLVAGQEFDPESLAYFRLMAELRERRREPGFVLVAPDDHRRSRRVVGGAVAWTTGAALSSGKDLPLGCKTLPYVLVGD